MMRAQGVKRRFPQTQVRRHEQNARRAAEIQKGSQIVPKPTIAKGSPPTLSLTSPVRKRHREGNKRWLAKEGNAGIRQPTGDRLRGRARAEDGKLGWRHIRESETAEAARRSTSRYGIRSQKNTREERRDTNRKDRGRKEKKHTIFPELRNKPGDRASSGEHRRAGT